MYCLVAAGVEPKHCGQDIHVIGIFFPRFRLKFLVGGDAFPCSRTKQAIDVFWSLKFRSPSAHLSTGACDKNEATLVAAHICWHTCDQCISVLPKDILWLTLLSPAFERAIGSSQALDMDVGIQSATAMIQTTPYIVTSVLTLPSPACECRRPLPSNETIPAATARS